MPWSLDICFFLFQGINGILADEMGLGKTVQSIAFLAHICEQYGMFSIDFYCFNTNPTT